MPPPSTVFLAVLAALLAGCSGSGPAADDADADPAPDAPRSTAPAPALTLLDVAIGFELNNAIPPEDFTVPANVTAIRVRYDVKSQGACEAVVGEPDATAGDGAWMEFVAPGGDVQRVGPLGGQLCQAVQPRPDFAGELDLPAQAGAWSVRFSGRGISAWLDLLVEGDVATA